MQVQRAEDLRGPNVEIRSEHRADAAAIRFVNEQAFETPLEAALVEALRREAAPLVSLVAVEQEAIVGHVLFSPVAFDAPGLPICGLAPMAVLPARQRSGIGSALVRAGLDQCRRLGFGAVVLVGHPEYYPRFGFVPASRFGLRCEYDVPDDVFMACELTRGALTGRTGMVRFHPAFARTGV
jgi:putative acetyltransferase